MVRYKGECKICSVKTNWIPYKETAETVIMNHLKGPSHSISNPISGEHYKITSARQCQECNENWYDQCAKCGKDFCEWHFESHKNECK
jgi:hypothetical protein